MSSSCPLAFLSIPPSCPCHFLGVSASLCMSPFLSLPVMSLHLPSRPLVSLSFVCLPVPPHSPCFHFFPRSCPFQLPFVAFSFPLAFLSCRLPVPCMSLHVPLFPPLISLHFLAFSLRSLAFFPRNTLFFPTFMQKRCETNREFFQSSSKRRQKPPNQQRAGRGIRGWEPVSCDTGSPKTIFSGTSSDSGCQCRRI